MAKKNDRFDVKMLLNRLLYSFYCFERWQFRVSVWLFLPIIRRFGKIIYDWNPWGEIDDNTTLEMFLERKLKESDYMWNNLDCGRGITIAFWYLPTLYAIMACYNFPSDPWRVRDNASMCLSIFVFSNKCTNLGFTPSPFGLKCR